MDIPSASSHLSSRNPVSLCLSKPVHPFVSSSLTNNQLPITRPQNLVVLQVFLLLHVQHPLSHQGIDIFIS